MIIDFKTYKYNYKDKYRIQDISANGKVKSKKDFPIFKENDSEYIFKPLSKTKPLLTTLFGCSEVFWSTIINNYFDSNAPIYRLAYCDGLDLENKYNKGTIVKSVINNDEKLVNLLEYYNNNPDKIVDIKNYINYCGIYYDYTNILSSTIFKNKNLGNELAKQILISILKNDVNYHYENVAFISNKDKIISLAPPIDHEFSSYFIYPDNEIMYSLYFRAFNVAFLFDTYNSTICNENIVKNIDLICSKYPNTTKEFLDNLYKFINDFKHYDFKLPSDYIEPLSSDMYKVYKLNENINNIKLTTINVDEYSRKIKNDILVGTNSYCAYLNDRLNKELIYIKK